MSPTTLSVLGILCLVSYYIQSFISRKNEFIENKKAWFQSTSYSLWKNWIEPFIVAGVLALVIRTYLLGPYKIPTGSMRPTFLEGDRIFVDKVSYRFHKPERGDIVVFKYPIEPKKDFVKRLIGLPGEKILIRDGKVLVNGVSLDDLPFSNYYYYNRPDWEYAQEGKEFTIPPDHYFVLGDNSAQSSDSRNWGFVPSKNMVGRAIFIWWPPKRVKHVG